MEDTKKHFKLDPKFKDRWVKALMSGRYEQNTNGNLQSALYPNLVCVLGVGGDLMFGNPRKGYEVIMDGEIEKELYSLNDAGVPFEVLAGIINEYL
jgi:hypothetical protein